MSGESSSKSTEIDFTIDPNDTEPKPKVAAKRGRPTSKKSIAAAAVCGIVYTPMSDKNIVELISNHPQLFKKLPDIIKCFNIIKMWIKFIPTGFEVNFLDHYRKSYNKLFIPGLSMVKYYYAPDANSAWVNKQSGLNGVYLACLHTDLSDILSSISDSFKELKIFVRRDDKKWYIAITDNIGCIESNEVPIPPTMTYAPSDGIPEYIAEKFDYSMCENYDISFELPAEKFKNIVSRANESNLTFSKKPDGDIITIECSPKGGVPFWCLFNEPDKISFKQKNKNNDYVVSKINSAHIKIASNTSIQFMKIVKISISAKKPISFRWYALDAENRETCVLHSYVELTD